MQRLRKALLSGLLLLAFLLTACWSPFLMKGYVISKNFVRGHYYSHWVTDYYQHCYGTKRNRYCTTTTSHHFVSQWIPDEYLISINECPAGTVPHGNESCNANTIDVDQYTFYSVHEGEYHDFN